MGNRIDHVYDHKTLIMDADSSLHQKRADRNRISSRHHNLTDSNIQKDRNGKKRKHKKQ